VLDAMTCKNHVQVCVIATLNTFMLSANGAEPVQSANPIRSDTEIANAIFDEAHAFRPEKTPLACEVGFDLINLVRVDEAKETYTIDFYAWVHWKDSRLVFQPRNSEPKVLNIPPSAAWGNDRLWNPHIEFMNVVETEVMQENLRLEASGDCEYTVRQTGTFTFAGEANAFRRFPFDQLDLPITVESFLWDQDHVRFAMEGGERTYTKNEFAKLKSAEYEIIRVRTKVSEQTYVSEKANFSVAAIILTLKRKPGFYLWRICLPLLILVAIAMSVVWIPHKHLESRLILSATTLVAVTTFSIVVNTNLPKLPYLTTIDVWMLVSFVLSAAGAIENVVVSSLAHRGRPKLSHKIDDYCRWLLPSLYLIASIVCIVVC
jgi:hypothetical protein